MSSGLNKKASHRCKAPWLWRLIRLILVMAAGIAVRAIDVRGHGLSRCVTETTCGTLDTPDYVDDGQTWPGRPGDSADENQLARDVQAHMADLSAQYPDARLALVGHSSGAGLVTRVLENRGMSDVDAAVVLAPFHHFEQPQNDLRTYECGAISGNSYSQVDVGAVGDAIRGNVHRYVLSLHKQADYLDPLDTLAYTYTTMMGMAAHDPDRFHEAYSGPTLWVAGTEDVMLDLEVSREEFQRLPGGQAFLTVRDTSHVGVSWSPAVAAWVAQFILDPSGVDSQTISPLLD